MAYETSHERTARFKKQGICLRCERNRGEGPNKPCSRCAVEIDRLIRDSRKPCMRCGRVEAIAVGVPCPDCEEAVYRDRCDGFTPHPGPFEALDSLTVILGLWKARVECRACVHCVVAKTGPGMTRRDYAVSCTKNAPGVAKTYAPEYNRSLECTVSKDQALD